MNEQKAWSIPGVFFGWPIGGLCGICRSPKAPLTVSCARCAAEGQILWQRIGVGKNELTLNEVIEALESLGYSEGAIDGATEQIEVSGLVEMTEDMDYREARL